MTSELSGSLPLIQDHIGLWAGELREWLPDELFDAHVHLSHPDAMGPLSAERRREALCTFDHFTWEEVRAAHERLFAGKTVSGLVAFPLPLREVNLESANAYVAAMMKRSPRVKGFLLSHPTDTPRTVAMFERALSGGARFYGVKPYFDLIGKSNYVTTMPEFIPEDLLAFMNRERLVMMLHSSGEGMGVPGNQDYIRGVLERHPRVRIIFAHMGRFLRVEDFFAFEESGLFEHPRVYLGMSNVANAEVYKRTLRLESRWERLLFSSDLPFGLIAGVEVWSEETGPIFVTRERYVWSLDDGPGGPTYGREDLTHNTYHVIKAFKDAVESLALEEGAAEALKRKVFAENARGLFARA